MAPKKNTKKMSLEQQQSILNDPCYVKKYSDLVRERYYAVISMELEPSPFGPGKRFCLRMTEVVNPQNKPTGSDMFFYYLSPSYAKTPKREVLENWMKTPDRTVLIQLLDVKRSKEMIFPIYHFTLANDSELQTPDNKFVTKQSSRKRKLIPLSSAVIEIKEEEDGSDADIVHVDEDYFADFTQRRE